MLYSALQVSDRISISKKMYSIFSQSQRFIPVKSDIKMVCPEENPTINKQRTKIKTKINRVEK